MFGSNLILPAMGFQLMFVCWVCSGLVGFHFVFISVTHSSHHVFMWLMLPWWCHLMMTSACACTLIVVECRVSLSICQTSLCTHWSLSIGQSVFNTDHSVLNTLGFQWDGISEAMLGYKYWTSSSFWLSCCEVNISPVYIASRHGRMD